MNYIIYEFTYGLNPCIIPWTKYSYVIPYVILIFSIDYIIYKFTHELNPYVISWMQICI